MNFCRGSGISTTNAFGFYNLYYEVRSTKDKIRKLEKYKLKKYKKKTNNMIHVQLTIFADFLTCFIVVFAGATTFARTNSI
jgi:hypothetical protein